MYLEKKLNRSDYDPTHFATTNKTTYFVLRGYEQILTQLYQI